MIEDEEIKEPVEPKEDDLVDDDLVDDDEAKGDDGELSYLTPEN